MRQALRLTPVILNTWEAEIRRIRVPSQPREIVGKIPSQKRAGGGAPVVEHLLSKYEALSKNPNAADTKRLK
jgi:hypothetical protein